MVQIPTSRDINRQSTRSGRIAPNAPRGGIGEALAGFGQDITRVAYDLNDLRTQEQSDLNNKAGYDLETKITEFRNQEEQAFNRAREGASESGIGFTRSFVEGYETRVNEFIKNNFTGISEAQDAQSRNALLGLGNSLYGKAYAYESQSKLNFYDRTTNQGLDGIRTQIRNNSAPYEELKRQGLAAIDAADMPEAWKAEKRAAWDGDAAESKWRWEYSKNPQEAIQKISGAPVGNVVDKIIGAESGGNANAKNPNSSATGPGQFIASTWMKMIKTYRPELADGKSASDVLALRSDPALSREMTTRYTQENAEYLRNQGIQQTDGNVYLAHFLGPGGASRVLKADPNASAASIVGEGVVNANPFLRGMSVADLKAWSDKKMGGAGVTSGTVSDEYNDIPEDRRFALAQQGQSEYNQMLARQRTENKERYNLLIATDPNSVSREVILRDNKLDTGDKAALITSLNSAQKESAGVNELIAAMSSGDVAINPFDADQRKLGNKAYEKMLGAATTPDQQAVVTSGFVASTGYIPEKVQADLRRGAASTNPADVAQAMDAANVLQKNAPVSFGAFDGSASVSKSLDLYKTYTQSMGYTPDEAARKIIASNDPESIRRRDALLKSEPIKKLLKDKSATDVAAIFDKGWLSSSPDVGAGASLAQVQVGVNPEAEAAIVADYRSVLEEALVDANGDQAAAEDIAKRRFQTIYGTTELSPLSSNIVVRYPPEKAYPAMADGSHSYIREQLVEALKGEGIEADGYYLQGDADTEKDILSGKPPRYQVFYEKNGKLERLNVPFYADVDTAKATHKTKQEQTVRDAEQRMLENRREFQGRYDSLSPDDRREQGLDDFLDGTPPFARKGDRLRPPLAEKGDRLPRPFSEKGDRLPRPASQKTDRPPRPFSQKTSRLPVGNGPFRTEGDT